MGDGCRGVLVRCQRAYGYRLPDPNANLRSSNSQRSTSIDEERPIGFIEAWLVPGVIPYALSYACLKSVNYVQFFWLPSYLSTYFKMSDANAAWYSMIYDVGQLLGGGFGGWALDNLDDGNGIVTASMMAVAAVLIWFLRLVDSLVWMAILLLLTGIFIGGPASLISSCIAADLGQSPHLIGKARAVATVSGIIDGTAAIVSACVQYIVGHISDCHSEEVAVSMERVCNWEPVFILLFFLVVGAITCLSSLVYREATKLWAGWGWIPYTSFTDSRALTDDVDPLQA